MNVHKNARLTPRGREWIVAGCKRADAEGRRRSRRRLPADSSQMGGAISPSEGLARIAGSQLATPSAASADAGCHREDRASAPPALTGKEIAAETGVSPATVSRILRRLGLNKLQRLEPAEPVRRYERETSGRTHPPRHQKARQNRLVGHRITGRSHRCGNRHPGHRLGVRPCLHRRCLAHRLRRDQEE